MRDSVSGMGEGEGRMKGRAGVSGPPHRFSIGKGIAGCMGDERGRG